MLFYYFYHLDFLHHEQLMVYLYKVLEEEENLILIFLIDIQTF